MSREIYENTHSLLREMLTEFNFKIDAGLSFKLQPTEASLSNSTISVGAEIGYERKTMVKDVSEFTKINVSVSSLQVIHTQEKS